MVSFQFSVIRLYTGTGSIAIYSAVTL